ncbi:MAG: hypothetical protein ACMXX9_04520 [Candidatus Woesearchaeota archaeon]
MNKLFWKRALHLEKNEIYFFLIAILTSGFILSFRKWGTDGFDYIIGLTNLAIYTFLFFSLFTIFVLTQKILAARKGYKAEFTLWTNGPLIGVLITFMTYGFLPFLYLGNVNLDPIKRLRIGLFRRETQFKDLMLVGLAGPLSLLILILLIIEPLYFVTGHPFLIEIMTVASIIILFTSLPLPHTNAMNILMYSRGLWLLIFVFGLVSIFLILLLNIISYVLALIVSMLIIVIFYFYSSDFF